MIGKKETFIVVYYSELEKLIWKTYPKVKNKYCIIEHEEYPIGTSHQIETDEVFTIYEQREMKKFKNGIVKQYDCSLQCIMNDMAMNGVIEKGKYLIEVY